MSVCRPLKPSPSAYRDGPESIWNNIRLQRFKEISYWLPPLMRERALLFIFSIARKEFLIARALPKIPIALKTTADRLLILHEEEEFSLYNLLTGDLIVDSELDSPIHFVEMDDERIVFGTKEGEIAIYSSRNGQLLKTLKNKHLLERWFYSEILQPWKTPKGLNSSISSRRRFFFNFLHRMG